MDGWVGLQCEEHYDIDPADHRLLFAISVTES